MNCPFPEPGWIMAQIARRNRLQRRRRLANHVMSNHYLPRAASRYCKGENDAQARIAMALLLPCAARPLCTTAKRSACATSPYAAVRSSTRPAEILALLQRPGRLPLPMHGMR